MSHVLNDSPARPLRVAAIGFLCLVLAGCGVPRSGPTKQEIMATSAERRGDAHIVAVDDRVNRLLAAPPEPGFSALFETAAVMGADTIRPGDVLSVTVWENVEQGILTGIAGSATTLSDVQVDGEGFIFIPYAGRVRASGMTPEQLRQEITRLLESQTPDPQVLVSRVAGDGASVSVMGKVGGQGIYPIEQPTRTLSSMLARAGGVTAEPDMAQVTVIRGRQRGTVWLDEIYKNPRNDIALRPGDRILVESDTRAFVAMGAIMGQTRINFRNRDLSALEALAQVGGLSTGTSDPTAVFVMRDQDAASANRVLDRSDLSGDQRMVYVVDLTKPSGVFIAREFMILDGDTIYVTEAPFVRWQRILSTITGTVTPVATIANAANGN